MSSQPDYESPYTSTGLVKELSDTMKYKVPTHPDWPESLACSMIGMAMGKDRYVDNILGNVYANIMVIVVGPSGIGFKTVPLKRWVRPILEEMSNSFNQIICKGYGLGENPPEIKEHSTLREIDHIKRFPAFSEYKNRTRISKRALTSERKSVEWKTERKLLNNINYRLVEYLKPERFTTEALTSILSDKPQGLIVGDEFTKTFKGAKYKDYLADNMEDLSRMADCDMGKVATQTRGIEYPEDAYVGFVSATTPYLLTMMDEEFFIQGTGNRILWIMDILDDKIVQTAVEMEAEALTGKFFWEISDEDAHKKRVIELATKLNNIKYLPVGLITFHFDASIELDRYRIKKYNDALKLAKQNILNKDSNLIVRLAHHAIRLSMIHCVGRYAYDFDPSAPRETSMEVSPEDAKWAIEKMERHLQHYIKMSRFNIDRSEKGGVRDYTKDKRRVLELYESNKRKGVKLTVNQLRNDTGWIAKDSTPLIQTMLMDGQIKIVVCLKKNRKDKTKRGNLVIHYVTPEDYETIWKDLHLNIDFSKLG